MFWHKDSFVHFSSIVARHPVMPRDTAGRSFATFFYHVIFAGKIKKYSTSSSVRAALAIGERPKEQ